MYEHPHARLQAWNASRLTFCALAPSLSLSVFSVFARVFGVKSFAFDIFLRPSIVSPGDVSGIDHQVGTIFQTRNGRVRWLARIQSAFGIRDPIFPASSSEHASAQIGYLQCDPYKSRVS